MHNMYIYIYMYIHVCVYIYIYIYIYMVPQWMIFRLVWTWKTSNKSEVLSLCWMYWSAMWMGSTFFGQNYIWIHHLFVELWVSNDDGANDQLVLCPTIPRLWAPPKAGFSVANVLFAVRGNSENGQGAGGDTARCFRIQVTTVLANY